LVDKDLSLRELIFEGIESLRQLLLGYCTGLTEQSPLAEERLLEYSDCAQFAAIGGNKNTLAGVSDCL
jgi:hypothetical protein